MDLAAWNSNDVVSVATNVAVDSSALHSKYRVCTSRECTTLASLFLSHLDEKVDPCRNMFDFACNNYKKLHDDGSFHSTIGDLQERLHRKLKRLLEVRSPVCFLTRFLFRMKCTTKTNHGTNYPKLFTKNAWTTVNIR